MSGSNTMGSETVDVSPLIDCSNERGGGGHEDGRWWKKVLDLEEGKRQMLFSLPMILTNVFYFLILLVAVMFAGHLGEIELAGSNLANSWANVTGFAFMIGLSGALETLCGQGFGAERYSMLGIYLQSSSMLTVLFCVVVSVIWWFTEPILVLLHQSVEIAEYAAVYMKFLIPGLFAFGFLQNILRFLQTQSVVLPLVICSASSMIIHCGITYVLVNLTPLAYAGAALAVSISMWISVLMLGGYVYFSNKFAQTWTGFSSESFCHVYTNFKLAMPSAAMVCLEYWAFELLVILAGLMPNSEITTSLVAMCVNTEAIAYNIVYGLSAAASTRVSNELGAGRIERAKHAMGVSLKLSLVLWLIIGLALGFGHSIWASLFSSSTTIIAKFGSMTPFLIASILFDSFQGVLSGVARGCGWQHLAVYINLGTYYCIGMPIAVVLAFVVKLYPKGLWLGLIAGLGCQAVSLWVVILRTKWARIGVYENNHNDNSAVDRSELL